MPPRSTSGATPDHNELKEKLKAEILKNAQILADFYNNIDESDRQVVMAHYFNCFH